MHQSIDPKSAANSARCELGPELKAFFDEQVVNAWQAFERFSQAVGEICWTRRLIEAEVIDNRLLSLDNVVEKVGPSLYGTERASQLRDLLRKAPASALREFQEQLEQIVSSDPNLMKSVETLPYRYTLAVRKEERMKIGARDIVRMQTQMREAFDLVRPVSIVIGGLASSLRREAADGYGDSSAGQKHIAAERLTKFNRLFTSLCFGEIGIRLGPDFKKALRDFSEVDSLLPELFPDFNHPVRKSISSRACDVLQGLNFSAAKLLPFVDDFGS